MEGDIDTAGRLCSYCRDLASAGDLRDTLKILAKSLVRVLEADVCSVGLLDEKGENLLLEEVCGPCPEAAEEEPVKLELGAPLKEALGGKTVTIPDLRAEQGIRCPKEPPGEEMRSMLLLPIMIGGKPGGLLRACSRSAGEFPDPKVKLARTLAMQGGIAIEKALLLQKIKALVEIALAVGSSLNLSDVLQAIVQSAVETLGFKASSIRLLDEEGEHMDIKATCGLSRAYLDKGPVEVEKSPLDQEVLGGKIVTIEDAYEDNRLQYPEEARREGIRSMLCLPLWVKKRVIGVLRVYSSIVRGFGPSEQDFLRALAAQGAVAVENARLYEHLKRDYEDLTRDVWRWYDWGSHPPKI
jgi:GAF domain-containing protein